MSLYDPGQLPAAADSSARLRAHIAAETMLTHPGNLAEAAERLSAEPGLVRPDHVRNLLTLALYLLDLPSDYRGFYMGSFSMCISECGSIACAVGHGPRALAVDPPEPWDTNLVSDDGWVAWSNLWLGQLTQEVWDFCFSGFWSSRDDTPQGAAARIVHAVTCDHPQRLRGPVGHLSDPDASPPRYSRLLEPLTSPPRS